jgi:hypothetical protein
MVKRKLSVHIEKNPKRLGNTSGIYIRNPRPDDPYCPYLGQEEELGNTDNIIHTAGSTSANSRGKNDQVKHLNRETKFKSSTM